MKVLKGLVTLSETGIGLLVSTLVLVLVRMRALQVPGPQTADLKAVWAWMLSSPLYWLAVLAVLGLSILLFRRWVFASSLESFG
jgi:hypothetical protein